MKINILFQDTKSPSPPFLSDYFRNVRVQMADEKLPLKAPIRRSDKLNTIPPAPPAPLYMPLFPKGPISSL